MALKIPLPRSSARVLPSEGTHLAACLSVIFMGTQTSAWSGETQERQQLRIGFELADEFLDDGRPLIAARSYTYSWHPNAALRGDLESWLGRLITDDFDLASLIGRAAIIGIGHGTGSNGTYAFISSVLPVPAGQPQKLRLVNKPSVITPIAFDPVVLNEQPEWLRDKIRSAPEYQNVLKGGPPPERLYGELQRRIADSTAPGAGLAADLDDNIPF